jgi:hypothetical protein
LGDSRLRVKAPKKRYIGQTELLKKGMEHIAIKNGKVLVHGVGFVRIIIQTRVRLKTEEVSFLQIKLFSVVNQVAFPGQNILKRIKIRVGTPDKVLFHGMRYSGAIDNQRHNGVFFVIDDIIVLILSAGYFKVYSINGGKFLHETNPHLFGIFLYCLKRNLIIHFYR